MFVCVCVCVCVQGSKRIRQWSINWCSSPKLTHLCITRSDWNLWTLNFMNQPIQIQWNWPKLLSQRIGICYYKTLGTSVIYSPVSPPFLCVCINRSIYAFLSINFHSFISFILMLSTGIKRDKTMADKLTNIPRTINRLPN